MILHVCTIEEWDAQLNAPAFKPASYDKELFVHCCLSAQLPGVLERYFAGKTGLLLLSIDEKLLQANVLYEDGPNGDKFPHVYGLLNREAIVKVERLR